MPQAGLQKSTLIGRAVFTQSPPNPLALISSPSSVRSSRKTSLVRPKLPLRRQSSIRLCKDALGESTHVKGGDSEALPATIMVVSRLTSSCTREMEGKSQILLGPLRALLVLKKPEERGGAASLPSGANQSTCQSN